jgi:hypothetical protein
MKLPLRYLKIISSGGTGYATRNLIRDNIINDLNQEQQKLEELKVEDVPLGDGFIKI